MLSGFLTLAPFVPTHQVILHNNSYILWLFSTLRRKMIHQPGTNPANNTTCDAYLKTNIQQLLIRYILIS
ncbi:hypothetical protein SQ43_08395 [Klebsiella pneumoniae]|nr:hypothetical protein SQ43_08395 [Klebsiella pneumoniae]